MDFLPRIFQDRNMSQPSLFVSMSADVKICCSVRDLNALGMMSRLGECECSARPWDYKVLLCYEQKHKRKAHKAQCPECGKPKERPVVCHGCKR
jgi:hypothetical protein